MAGTPQPALPALEHVAAPRAPLRGRGATPVCDFVADIAAPNPTGRTALRFRFRPLKRHSAARLRAACELIVDYFAAVGGFVIADDAVVRAFADVLLLDTEPHAPGCENLYTPQQVRDAISAKAESLRPQRGADPRKKRAFIAAPENFPRTVGAWYERSARFMAEQDAAASAARRAALDARARAALEQIERERPQAEAVFADLKSFARAFVERSAADCKAPLCSPPDGDCKAPPCSPPDGDCKAPLCSPPCCEGRP